MLSYFTLLAVKENYLSPLLLILAEHSKRHLDAFGAELLYSNIFMFI